MLLGLAPLLEGGKKLIDAQTLIADCKSGVSGAGRKAEVGSLFSEASDNFKAYGVAGHRHHPEIVSQLEKIAGGKVGLTFVPHLVPMIRGMYSTLYARILPEARDTDFQALFEQRYADEAFVDVMPAGSLPETRSVRASNNLRIALSRPQWRPADRDGGAGQPGQGRRRPGRAEHEPDVRLRGIHRPGPGRDPALMHCRKGGWPPFRVPCPTILPSLRNRAVLADWRASASRSR